MVPIALLVSLLSCCHWKAQSEAACKSNDDVVGKTTMLASELRERVLHQFLIIAHKGYSSAHQENSLNAFEAAMDAGADVIEADVRESADGTIVLSHDDVADRTLDELKSKGIIPLSSLLQLAKNRIALLLDIKESSSPFLRKVFDAVDQHDLLDQVIFGVRDVEQSRELRTMSPKAVILGLLSRPRYNFGDFYQAGGDIARIWEADLDPSTIKAARGDGSRPIWITPRSPLMVVGDIDESRQRALMKWGFDGVLVNNPASAIAVRCSFLDVPD
jgi:glycerophosphoryl diester phosphodiesterase